MKKEMNFLIKIFILTILLIQGCQNNTETRNQKKELAKFEPADGKCLLFAGQELEAIGGLEQYANGYFNYFPTPAGFTMYTNFRPGDTSFGHVYKGLDGLITTDDWGDGPSNMQSQLEDEDFKNSALAIGLELVHHEDSVAMGVHDDLIVRLGNWLKGLGDRPVFLRIGYEFDGTEWNFYEKEPYKAAFKRIRNKLDSMGVTNVAYIWQSKGWGSSYKELEEWYPGDEYVDWCAYSFFSRYQQAQPMIDFARKRNKPVFIAEATPSIEENGISKRIDLSDSLSQIEAWEKWFNPFFKTIQDNPDVVKAVSYINCNWKAHRMWQGGSPFQDIDARLHTGRWISEKWIEETSRPHFIHASKELFQRLKENNN